jgi:hypothetical protein
LNTRFPGGLKGVDGLPSGHPNLNDSHPGLLKDFPKGILIIEMLPASLRPKEVEDKTAKDVKRLSDVGEAPYMVPLDPGGGVIFSLEDGLTQHDEWLEESDIIGCSSFLPDVIEGTQRQEPLEFISFINGHLQFILERRNTLDIRCYALLRSKFY